MLLEEGGWADKAALAKKGRDQIEQDGDDSAVEDPAHLPQLP